MFTEYPPAIDHDKLIFALNRIAKAVGSDTQGPKPVRQILGESPSSYAAKGGKSIPTIDNLLVLAHLFDAAVEEIVIQRMIEVEVSCVSNKIEKFCNKNCNDCKLRLSA